MCEKSLPYGKDGYDTDDEGWITSPIKIEQTTSNESNKKMLVLNQISSQSEKDSRNIKGKSNLQEMKSKKGSKNIKDKSNSQEMEKIIFEILLEVVPEMLPEIISEMLLEIISKVLPEVEIILEMLLEVIPEMLLEIIPEILPEVKVIPEMLLEIIPEVLPEIIPEMLPEIILEVLLEVPKNYSSSSFSSQLSSSPEPNVYLKYEDMDKSLRNALQLLDLNKTYQQQQTFVDYTVIPLVSKTINKRVFLVVDGVIKHIIYEQHRHQHEEYLNKKKGAKWVDAKARKKHSNSRLIE
ncbi:11938_t:CDS:2, partial [Dentiscutata erythropus]